MPKMKTHSGIRKRVKVTGSGKIVHQQVRQAAQPGGQADKRTRRLDGIAEVSKADVPRVRRAAGQLTPRPAVAPNARHHSAELDPAAAHSRLDTEGQVPVARVKRAVNAQKKRRTILERASGYRGQRSRLYRKAKEQMLHSMQYAYKDRRKRKGDFRKLWITRINAAARANGMTYNRLMQGLKLAGVEVDRKVLAELAVHDEAAFAALVAVAREAVPPVAESADCREN